MILCLNCGLQRPNKYKYYTCPECGSYLKYVESPAKSTAFKLHRAGLSISYAVAEVYSYSNGSLHSVNIRIGLAVPYQAAVLSGLPDGIGYVLPHSYDSLNYLPSSHLLSHVRTYGLIRYEIPYLDPKEAKKVLKQKLKELNDWVDYSTDWFSICNLGGLL